MKQISLFGTERSTYSRADSPVSHIQPQGNDLGKRTSDISGRRCLERLEKLNHVGSLAKTFTVLLVGMTGWSSKRCKLTWKMKGTKSNRIYFQLHPSTLPTEEIEYGLWRTPTAMDTNEDNLKAAAKLIQNKTHRSSGHPVQITLGQQVAMEYLKKNPHLIDYYGNQEYEARENLPPKEDLVAYLKTQLTRKEAIKLTGEKKTLIDHWFRTDSGHSYPSIENWEKLKKGMKEIRYDKEMTETVSKEWTGLLLPTPATIQIDYKPKEGWEWMGNYWKDENGVKRQTDLATTVKMTMLPTPTAVDGMRGVNANTTTIENGRFVRTSETTGTKFGASLGQAAATGMLPTPKSQEARGNASRDRGKKNLTDEVSKLHDHDGTSSQLNPLFVEEMMGFPENWTLLPFLNGETNPSKPTETPSSHK